MIKVILTVTVLSLFIGCGSGNSSLTKTESSRDISFPLKPTIELPDVLLTIEDNLSLEEQNLDIAFREPMRTNVFIIRATMSTLNESAIIARHILPLVSNICEDNFEEELCSISENTLSLTLTEALINELNEVQFVDFSVDRDKIIGEDVLLGAIEFRKYDDSLSLYQYALKVDLTNVYKKIGLVDEGHTFVEHFKWSEDTNNLWYSLVEKSNGTLDEEWTFFYHNNPVDQDKKVHFTVKLPNNIKLDQSIEDSIISFNLHQVLGDNPLFTLRFNLVYETKFATHVNDNSVANSIHIDSKGISYQYFGKSLVDNEELYGKVQIGYDKEGKMIFLSDVLSEETALYETCASDALLSGCELSKAFTKIPLDRDMSVADGNLKDGNYFLLPPDYNTTQLTTKKIFNNYIGELIVINKAHTATLYDQNYIANLNDVRIVYINNRDELGEDNFPLFEVLEGENKLLLLP